jgi:putative Ca2+/H+ antiporter (TMEM165/GDT1 family)
MPLQALLTSTAVVALAEIGDKTQLLAILLATRFKRPWPIIAGILVATMVNHFFAALIGSEVASFLDGKWFRFAVAASFIAMAAWTLVPDKLDDEEEAKPPRFGVFVTTVIAFFLVEMGDKTQIATIALGARYHDALQVAAGTTLGMMLANVPAVFLGHELIRRVPLHVVRWVTAALFAAIGLWLLLQTAGVV